MAKKATQKKQEVNKYRRFYFFHGIELNKVGDRYVGTCPFCEKEEHFYVHPGNGTYECKRCGESGNHYTFIQGLSELSVRTSGAHQLSELSINRGIKEATLQHLGIARSSTTGKWIIPSRGQKGTVVNLYQCEQVSRGSGEENGRGNSTEESNGTTLRSSSGRNGDISHSPLPKWCKPTSANRQIAQLKFDVRSSPTPCEQQLYGIDTITKHTKRIYIVEGHWDRAALLEILSQLEPKQKDDHLTGINDYDGRFKRTTKQNFDNEILKTWAVVGLPGATTIKKEWVSKFKNKELIDIHDNDEAGGKGIAKLVKECSAAGISSFHRMDWGEHRFNDIRDLLYKMNPLQAFNFIHENLVMQDVETVSNSDDDDFGLEPEECKSFNELTEIYDENLHFLYEHKMTLLIMLATVMSPFTGGPQIGLRVIGRPGSLKSTFAEALAQAKKYVYARSKFTGLVSGDRKVVKKAMLAYKIDGMCLLVKDADPMLQMSNLSEVESEIRDSLADNVIRPEYRTGESFEIRTVYSLILCGTKTLRNMDDALLGSRFIDCVIHKDTSEDKKIIRRAMDTEFSALARGMSAEKPTVKMDAVIEAIAPKTMGFLDHIHNKLETGIHFKDPTDNQKHRIEAMADLIGMCRAGVERDSADDLKHRPEQELGSRLVKQLTRLAMMISVLLSNNNSAQFTKKNLDVLLKIVHDTCYGWRYEIIEILASAKRPMRADDIVLEGKDFTDTLTRRHLADMEALNLIQTEKRPNSHGRGRSPVFYTLQPMVLNTYLIAVGRKTK